MKNFERDYARLIASTLTEGKVSEGRNGSTVSTFGAQLTFNMAPPNKHMRYSFPLLLGRKMYFNGILGEFVSFLQSATTLSEFKANGCNYWESWADDDGSLRLDYGTAWTDVHGYNQLAATIASIKEEPHSRRHLINTWRPERVLSGELSLPCCHYSYQWYVRGRYLDMVWIQRSVDLMVGLPSDIALAAIFNIMMAKLTNYQPGRLIFQLGDCHVYQDHVFDAIKYLDRINRMDFNYTDYPTVDVLPITKYHDVDTDFIVLNNYNPADPIKFELIS